MMGFQKKTARIAATRPAEPATGGDSDLIYLRAVQVGGSDGNSANVGTYTYQLQRMNGTNVGPVTNPDTNGFFDFKRADVGSIRPAQHAIAIADSNGSNPHGVNVIWMDEYSFFAEY